MTDLDFVRTMARAEKELEEHGQEINPGRWQGIDTAGKPDLTTVELLNWRSETDCYRPGYGGIDRIAWELRPNRDWADEHFAERIGGRPLNPDPSHERWPHWHGQTSSTQEEGKFSHTYSERFWPKRAGEDGAVIGRDRDGIRYKFGDYSDLLLQLGQDPHTRQAYLPIFFPEDTGGVHRGRVPCTLGYHFMLRDGRFHVWYDIRSCDIYRHMRDDLYLAVKLMYYTLERLQNRDDAWAGVRPGTLYFCAHSLHIHKGDWHHVYPR